MIHSEKTMPPYPDSKSSCKALAKKLEKELSSIKKAAFPGGNFHEGEIGSVLDEGRNTVPSLRALKCVYQRGSLPYAYITAKEFYSENIKADADAVTGFAIKYESQLGKDFGYAEYLAFLPCARAAVISLIHDLCKEKINGEGREELDEKLFGYIFSLRILSFLTPYSCFEKGEYEKLFSYDPSGAYPDMTSSTKEALKYSVYKKAKRENIPEKVLLSQLVGQAKNETEKRKRYIGYYISEDKKAAKYTYFILLALLTASVSAFLSGNVLIFIPTLFPAYAASKMLTDYIFSFFAEPAAPIAEIATDEIPDDAKTLCVITSLLRGEKSDSEIFSRLEKIYNANCGKNIRFGLLCDLCDSETATVSTDEKMIKYASDRIDSLNTKYGNDFIFFVRTRGYSKSEKVFMPYERKRGAVIELVKLIMGESTSFDMTPQSLSESLPFLKDVKYIITLDQDTNLGISKAQRLVGKMLHPANTPLVDTKTHTVKEGYGILQPHMSPELSSGRKTPFSRMMCGASGRELYSSACFDIYSSLFSQGIFCGKGIFDVRAFYDTVIKSELFPDDAVLSHDIPEGELLRCGQLYDIILTDSFPKNSISYFKRSHRWIRGDIQNMIFLSGIVKNRERRIKNNLTALSKYKLFDNIVRAAEPIASLSLIVIAFLIRKNIPLLVLAAFLPSLMPLLIQALGLFLSGGIKTAARRFYSSGITSGLFSGMLRCAYSCCSLCKSAFISLSAISISLYRMIFTKKKLLEWVTSAQSDSGKADLPAFISKHIFPSVTGALIFIFSSDGLLRLCGILFFITPLIGYYTSKNHTKKRKRIDGGAQYLIYAKDIWKFFSENVNEKTSHLPPDHIRVYGGHTADFKTSPTNIGLYMLSVLCARDFGLIDSKELFERTKNALDSVKKLPKWHGNLYNWYDVRKLSLVPPYYVSSVDSGNFIGCLIALKNGISDYADEEPALLGLINEISGIIEKTDFKCLFDDSRSLFSIGATALPWRVEKDSACYDYLMSESRILSFIAVASRNVPVAHWEKLSRQLLEKNGHIGLASWSGTAFEYYMPQLFMPTCEGSLIFEAMHYAFDRQRERNFSGIFGISESEYHMFDENGGYMYRAFGIPELAKDPNLGRDLVISPYSSFLSLCINDSIPLENLNNLKNIGAYGSYGFFEAVDFTHKKSDGRPGTVKSYMSHHLGMSMIALSNAAFDKNIIKRFMREPACACGEELLEEKIPVNTPIYNFK